MRSSLSVGGEALKATESSVIPRNSSVVAGPSVFSRERGTPSCENTVVSAWRPCAGGGRKSSRRWTRKGTLDSLRRIQLSASERQSNKRGLLLQLNASRTEK